MEIRVQNILFRKVLSRITLFLIHSANLKSRPVVITIFTQSVRPSVGTSVRPKTSKSSDNHCRPGLWAGRVDNWLLLFCWNLYLERYELGLHCTVYFSSGAKSKSTVNRVARVIKGNVTLESFFSSLSSEADKKQRAVLVVQKRHVTRKFKIYTQFWEILI